MTRSSGDSLAVAVLAAVCGCGRLAFDVIDVRDDGASDMAIATTCDAPDVRLAACYSFDGDAIDRSSFANHATGTSVSYESGRVGGAMRLDATSLISAPTATSLDLVTALSIDVWIWIDQLPPPGTRSVIQDYNSGYITWVANDSSVAFALYIGGAAVVSSPPTMSITNRWTHVAVTYDGVMQMVWIDGVAVAMRAQAGPIGVSDNSGLSIGGNLPDVANPNPDRFVGRIDELRVWSTSLPSQEICRAAGTC